MNKLKTKDLIYAGGYAVLYMIIAMVCSMSMGIMPILTVYGFPFVAGKLVKKHFEKAGMI